MAGVQIQDDNALSNTHCVSDTGEPAINQDDLKPAVSLEKSDNNALRNTHCVVNNGKIANCVHCGQPFERRTTWHKYCSEACKIKAYEQRTGKKWYSKTTAGKAQ